MPTIKAKRPWLSIALPAYNVADYLEACLASIADQELDGVEVVVVEDCSTDATPALLQRLQQDMLPSLKIVWHERNRGLSAARNTALDLVQGEYLWFIDSDDLLASGAVQALREAVVRWQPDLVLCDFSVHRPAVKLKHRLRGEGHRSTFSGPSRQLISDPLRVLAGAMRSGQLHTWSKIAKRALWADDLRFPEGRFFEDLYTTPELLTRTRRCVHIPQAWVAYRQRPGSILKTLKPAQLDDQFQAIAQWTMPYADRQDPIARRARLEVDAQLARIFTGACRQLWKLRGDKSPYFLASDWVSQFDTAMALRSGSWRDLLGALLRKGRVARAARFYFWLRKARDQGQ